MESKNFKQQLRESKVKANMSENNGMYNYISVEDYIKQREADIIYLEMFLRSVNAKLNNELFVTNARPEIIANEKRKKADAEAKIEINKKVLRELRDAEAKPTVGLFLKALCFGLLIYAFAPIKTLIKILGEEI
ncbi:hypothetical protein [Pedobacter sp. N23S346]|uniref:hypothetical protein n=1 Tax=Pedobacter sp. N23S346 TaxID=3402750 RepID=UPI003AD1F193